MVKPVACYCEKQIDAEDGQYVELGNFGSGLFLVDLLVAINEGGGVGDNGNGIVQLRWLI